MDPRLSQSLRRRTTAEPLPGRARHASNVCTAEGLVIIAEHQGVEPRVRRNRGRLWCGLPLVGRRCCAHGLAALMVDSKRAELLGDSL